MRPLVQPVLQQGWFTIFPQAFGVSMHLNVHVAALPEGVRVKSASLTQAVCWAAHAEGGSQVSPASTTPFPHLGAQSLSFVLSQEDGQQPSPELHSVC